jgi:hypothetical protein
MNLAGAAQGLWTSFREADVADFSFFHQLRHLADCLFNRRIRIHAMLVVKIDVFDTQPTQAAFTGFAHILRLSVYAAKGGIFGIADNAKFRGDHDLVALSTADGFANQFFIEMRPVRIGGVEKIDSEFESTVYGRDRFVVITATVEVRHAHAAETESRDFKFFAAKPASLHSDPPGNYQYMIDAPAKCAGARNREC